jgi:hypothetical protein
MRSACGFSSCSSTSSGGLFHVDPTRAVHHEAVTYLFDLILDLDFLRIGKPTLKALSVSRLASWEAIAGRVRKCWEARHLDGGHEEELAYGDALVAWVRTELAADRTPTLPENGMAAFAAARRRLERCREEGVKR